MKLPIDRAEPGDMLGIQRLIGHIGLPCRWAESHPACFSLVVDSLNSLVLPQIDGEYVCSSSITCQGYATKRINVARSWHV